MRKSQLFEAQDRVADMKRLATEKLDEAVEAYLAALDDDPESTDISLELAELAWTQLLELDEVDNPSARDVFHWRSLVKAHGCGFYDARLQGNGALRVETQIPQAKATLYWVKASGALLERRNAHVLGKTPTRAVSLPMGSYHVVVEADGRPPLHYPVRLRRSEVVSLHAHLHKQREIGEGFVFVPPGPAILGGDPNLPHYRKRPREVRDLAGFFIMRTHVTCGDYLDYLRDLPPEQAIARAPRAGSGKAFWSPGDDGQWQLPAEPPPFSKLPWSLEWPIVSVSFEDAQDYVRWRSLRDSRRLDLPTSDQWEKAARGADGRFFPWGNHFDSSLCNLPAAGSSGAAPAPVGSFPGDRSPYGVLDLAGNALDQVYLGDLEDEERLCGARGGGWHVRNLLSRSAAVAQVRVEDCHPFLSFRLVATPEDGWEL